MTDLAELPPRAAAAAGDPLLAPWPGRWQAPPFDRMVVAGFVPAFEAAIAEAREEVAAITANPAPPDFANTIAALERSGATLSRVRRLFWALSSAHATPELRAIEAEVSRLLTRHGTEISHDDALFARIAAVWRTRDAGSLDEAQRRLVDDSYKGFMRGGAALDGAAKARFAEIDGRLAALSIDFGQNVLAAGNAWAMLLDAADLDGLPPAMRDAARGRAEAAGETGRFLFTLDRTDFEGILTFSSRRDLRERIWRAFTTRCDGGAHDNNPLIAEIVALRRESAGLLGYPSYADFALDDSMVGSPQAAEALLMRLWGPARVQAIAEAAELQALIDGEQGGFTLAAWDWRYYAERIRRERFDLDAAAVASHLRLDGVRKAAFDAAGRLYGLSFERRAEVPVYHPDVAAWSVSDAAGLPVGLLYTDYLARPEKHGGAWMGSLRAQEKMDGAVRPIVYTVANFARAPDPAESRLSLDEARTLFHEFGHALHALLSDVTYPSQAGTAVARDFVEFPSKFMEHWVLAPEALRGFGMDEALIEAIHRTETVGQGFSTIELLASSIVDLALHRTQEAAIDPAAFERDQLARLDIPPAIPMRHRLPHFTHVFDGGYAGAYYSYLWSEVLDADAFAAFAERGDLFAPDLARRFRDEILAKGDSRDPMASYVAFRGRLPDETPLLRSRGLA